MNDTSPRTGAGPAASRPGRRVVFGTDHPFPVEPPDALRALEAVAEGLGLAVEQSRAILGGTAAELWGFAPAGKG